MGTYCVRCRKDTENLISKIFKTKNCRLIMLPECPDCGFEKSRFAKKTRSKRITQ